MKRHYLYGMIVMWVLLGAFLALALTPVLAGYHPLGLDADRYITIESVISPDAQSRAVVVRDRTRETYSLYIESFEDQSIRFLLYNDPLLEDMSGQVLVFTPDSQGIVFTQEANIQNTAIYYTSLVEGDPRLLTIVNDSRLDFAFLQEADAYNLLYNDSLSPTYDSRLYVLSLADVSITPFATDLPEGGIRRWVVSPDGRYLVVTQENQVSYVSINDQTIIPIATYEDGSVSPYISNDSRHVLYIFDDDELTQFYHYDTVTRDLTLIVSAQGQADHLGAVVFTPDSQTIVYDQQVNFTYEKLMAYNTLSQQQTMIYRSTYRFIWEFYLAPDSRHVMVYDLNAGNGNEEIAALYVTSIDQISTPHLLTDKFATGPVAATPSGWVLYFEEGAGDLGDYLYAAPMDGSAPPLLKHPLPNVEDFALDPSGYYVYYRVADVAGGGELRVAPVIPNKEGVFILYDTTNTDDNASPLIYHVFEDYRVYFRSSGTDYIADGQFGFAAWQGQDMLGTEGITIEVPIVIDAASAFATTTLSIEVEAASATYGEDYTLLTNTLTFPPGTTRGVVPIQIMSDNEADSGEVVILRLTDPHGIRLTEPTTTTLTLYDTLYHVALPTIRR